jgi:hypothetical protein
VHIGNACSSTRCRYRQKLDDRIFQPETDRMRDTFLMGLTGPTGYSLSTRQCFTMWSVGPFTWPCIDDEFPHLAPRAAAMWKQWYPVCFGNAYIVCNFVLYTAPRFDCPACIFRQHPASQRA